MVADTTTRVAENTAPEINERIRRRNEETTAEIAARGSAAIDERLHALDREWDIERTLEANAAAAALAGVIAAALFDRRFLAVPGLVAAFLLQHAVQGWCPPVPLFRRLGVRTPSEIAAERHALKALRGDFASVEAAATPRDRARRALAAARR